VDCNHRANLLTRLAAFDTVYENIMIDAGFL
jgi:hypothetical protein